MRFKITPVQPTPPDYQAFTDGLASGRLDRAGALSEAERLSGVTVCDIGNTDMYDLILSLRTLVYRKLTKMPDREGCMPNEINYLVIGHAGGSGNNWFFLGNAGRVNDYVNANVPKGEKAWVLACETGNDRYFNKLEGRELISTGPQLARPR